jgi:hypothetical protein
MKILILTMCHQTNDEIFDTFKKIWLDKIEILKNKNYSIDVKFLYCSEFDEITHNYIINKNDLLSNCKEDYWTSLLKKIIYNMLNFIQLNKFSELHNNYDIIFCKTDYLLQEFKNIEKINNNVVLISGNSDYPITDYHINLLPNNVKIWYAQNALNYSDILNPIPIGLQNKLSSKRECHGIGYFEEGNVKENLLNRNLKINPSKFIYSNFNINTNIEERIKYKNVSINTDFIDWEESNLSLERYFNKILEYEMILCPIGNGVDTHRLWEVLYSDRIPITIKVGDYKIYELYKHFPIIILDEIEDLKNKELLETKLVEIKNKKYNQNMLYFDYWKQEIIKNIK